MEEVKEEEDEEVKKPTAATAAAFRYEERTGDLFQSSASLVHCVSSDLSMGKGVAVKFKEKFGKVNELKAQKKDVGEVAYIDVSESTR